MYHATHFEVCKNDSRLIITVEGGIVVEVYSPTHQCFNPVLLMGQDWDAIRAGFEAQGFLVHAGH